MITVFNRAELLLTHDLDRLNRARGALEGAGIDYQCRVRDLARRNRGRDGALGSTRTPGWSTSCTSGGTSWTGPGRFCGSNETIKGATYGNPV